MSDTNLDSNKSEKNNFEVLNELCKNHLKGRRDVSNLVPKRSQYFLRKDNGCPIKKDRVSFKINKLKNIKKERMGKITESATANDEPSSSAKKRKIRNRATNNLKESDIIVNDIMDLINKRNKKLGKNYTSEVFTKLFEVASESEMELENTENDNETDNMMVINENQLTSVSEVAENNKDTQCIDSMNQNNKKMKKGKNKVIVDKTSSVKQTATSNLPISTPMPVNTKAKPQKKVPPIVVDTLNVHEFMKNNEKIKGDFTIKILKNEKKIINCANEDAHKAIISNLKEKNINAHTFQSVSERNVVLLCYGIHFTVPEDEILLELKELYGDCIVSVRHHVTPRSKARNYNLDQHIINVKNTANIGQILSTKGLAQHSVFLKKYIIKSTAQCLNCWSYGHTKTYCMRPSRCIKCTEIHPPKECRKLDEDAPTCVNCKGAHTANYRGCPVNSDNRLMTTQPKVTRSDGASHFSDGRRMNWQPASDTPPRFTTANRPFNEIIKNTFNSNNINDFPSLPNVRSSSGGGVDSDGAMNRILFEEPQKLFGMDIFALMEKVTNFSQHYDKLNSIYDKQCAYFKFIKLLTNPING